MDASEQQPGRTPPKPDFPRITKGEDSGLRTAIEEEPLYKEIEYPVPWKALSAACWRVVSEGAGEQWKKRTWWGKLKLAVAFPFLLMAAGGVGLMLVIIGPGLLLIPIIDAIVRLQKYNLDMPNTYKEGTDDR